jgi:hypothetical protein
MLHCAYGCFAVDSPFIGANPECPVHCSGGTLEQQAETESIIEQLRAEIQELRARLAVVESK